MTVRSPRERITSLQLLALNLRNRVPLVRAEDRSIVEAQWQAVEWAIANLTVRVDDETEAMRKERAASLARDYFAESWDAALKYRHGDGNTLRDLRKSVLYSAQCARMTGRADGATGQFIADMLVLKVGAAEAFEELAARALGLANG